MTPPLVDTLAPMWRRVVETTEAGEWKLPEGVAALVLRDNAWIYVSEFGYRGTAPVATAYRIINADGSTGPRVERPVTVTRTWTEKPPNDDTRIVLLLEDAIAMWSGDDCQLPEGKEIAWTTWGEFAASLSAPRVVEVTTDDVHDALGEAIGKVGNAAHRLCVADFINARLCQRGERGA